MKITNRIFLFGSLLAGVLTSCLSDNEGLFEYEITATDVAVTDFHLAADDSILAGLDSVFFAIDLDNARIYNPDSLPMGTPVSRLIINPSFNDISKAEVIYRLDNGNDTTINYATNSTDSINFANGPVTLRLTSLDQKVVRDYSISVNVHKTNPNLLLWDQSAVLQLPANASNVEKFGVAQRGEYVYALFQGSGTDNKVFKGKLDELGSDSKSCQAVFPENLVPSTLAASDKALYVIAGGRLMANNSEKIAELADMTNWTDCGEMSYIYGVQNHTVLGAVCRDGGWKLVSYEESAGTLTEISALPDGFPVAATSQMLTFTTPWSLSSQSIIVGGQLPDNTTTGNVWAFDGNNWARIGQMPAMSDLAIVPYRTFRTSTDWVVTERSALIAMGGRISNDSICARSYISYDQGVHWEEASFLLDMPQFLAPHYGSRAFVADQTNHVEATAWSVLASAEIPRWFEVESYFQSRASKPLTEWQTPYIYLFGGYTIEEYFFPWVYRGAINRLIYKPLY